MKCFPALALVGLMVALPACAQHAAAHGGFSAHSSGFSGHSSFVSRGGFAGSAPSRPSGSFRSAAPFRYSGPRAYQAYRSPAVARGFSRSAPGYSGFRAPYNGDEHHRRPYGGRERWGSYYGAPGYAYVAPYFLGYPDDFDTSDDYDSTLSQNQAASAQENEEPEPDQQAELPPYPNYAPPPPYNYGSASPAHASAGPAPSPEEAVTLIFKDGRPPETIHNYVLTAKTLYVGDTHPRPIPIDELDLAATEKANEDAGVDFALPAGTR